MAELVERLTGGVVCTWWHESGKGCERLAGEVEKYLVNLYTTSVPPGVQNVPPGYDFGHAIYL